MTTSSRPLRRHVGGAPLLPPTISYAVLTILGVLLPPLLAGAKAWTSDAARLDFFQHHHGAAHASAFFTLGAAIPFAIFTVVSTSRLRTLGIDVPGRMIAMIGGTVATSMLAFAGVATLAATQDRVADSDAAVRVLYGLTFAAGGPAFVIFTGLLVAGISISGLLGGVLPRPLAWFGIAVAVVCELASATAAFDALDPLLPIGRFGSLLWMLAIAFMLPATRREWRARRGIVRAADEPGPSRPLAAETTAAGR